MASAMASDATGAGSEQQSARYSCPVLHTMADGRNPFVAIRPCGHVLSAKALRNLATKPKKTQGVAAPNEASL